MANTTLASGMSIQITGLDADWVWSTDCPSHLRKKSVESIQFNPSAANDVCRIRNASLTGATILYCKCSADTDQRVKYFQETSQVNPCIKISELTLNTAANASILIQLK